MTDASLKLAFVGVTSVSYGTLLPLYAKAVVTVKVTQWKSASIVVRQSCQCEPVFFRQSHLICSGLMVMLWYG